jgi:hypothetical protein
MVGCGKQSDFLYLIQDTQPKYFESVHKLKEITGASQVDILWVVDNSGSMQAHQTALIKNADLFINDFVGKAGLEWKMGLISNTQTDPPFIGFTPSTLMTHQTKDNVSRFKQAVRRLGLGGDTMEKFFLPIQEKLTRFPDFSRKNASLAIIVITDAPEQSRIPARTFLANMKKIKGDVKSFVFYGVLASVDFGCAAVDEPWNYAGSPYETVIKETKGKYYKLCNTDFGKNLADLGKDLVDRVKRSYIALKERPDIASLRVVYRGKDLQGGTADQGGIWTYNFSQNRVEFNSLDFAPGDTEEVTIQYRASDTKAP